MSQALRSKTKYHFFLLLALVQFSFGAPAAEAERAPSWRSKPKLFARIIDERAIITSVHADKIGDGQSVLIMEGGGLTSQPVDTVFARAQHYGDLKQVSDHIVEVKTGPLPEDLFLHTQAFRYHARMQMKVKAVTSPMRRIEFSVVSGHFTGMTGYFSFEDFKLKTILGFHAEYKYKVLPMPAFFVEFALEVVLQRVASHMREFLEK